MNSAETQPIIFSQDTLSATQSDLNRDLKQQPSIQQQLYLLQALLQECQSTWQQEKTHQTQQLLEKSLLTTVQTLLLLNIDPNGALQRATYRQRLSDRDNEAIVYADRIAFFAQGELRGEWPIHSQDEYHHYLDLAKDLGCTITHVDNKQLALF